MTYRKISAILMAVFFLRGVIVIASHNQANNACQRIASQAVDIDRSMRIPNGQVPIYKDWFVALRVCQKDVNSLNVPLLFDIKNWRYEDLFPLIYSKEVALSLGDESFYVRDSSKYRDLPSVEGAKITTY
ncbi:hypothetical protein QWZ04_10270 [Vibrio tapetis subsp. quintayensis]|uniref:hypothetical protein n=1 Tax=Vibrio tapetis TaxID=52443 RepID=UPI0025B3535D|nr:hypothetical protein [Vibrio tapetis]MDN3680704.1 hypothetical protein [Vibrio tapetis subsp. quintayensis]